MLEILYPSNDYEKLSLDDECIDMHNPTIEARKKKALLHKIYTKMGYKKIAAGEMAEFALFYPQLVQSKYVAYEKLLDYTAL